MLPVDVFGQPAAIEALLEVAGRHELVLIRDSCEAIGAERNGVGVGTKGKASVFAFYPNKQMTTGEGGIVVTDDADFARLIRSMANQGRDDNGTWMNHVRLGYNYRLDEISAALGLSQLARLDSILDRRARGRRLVRRAARRARRGPHPTRRARDDADELVRLRHPRRPRGSTARP